MSENTQATENTKEIDIENLSFEAAMSELEAIVGNLETGKAALEDSITAYERGIALKSHCEKKLQEAQAKIEKITINKDGSLSTEPFAAQE